MEGEQHRCLLMVLLDLSLRQCLYRFALVTREDGDIFLGKLVPNKEVRCYKCMQCARLNERTERVNTSRPLQSLSMQ